MIPKSPVIRSIAGKSVKGRAAASRRCQKGTLDGFSSYAPSQSDGDIKTRAVPQGAEGPGELFS